MKKIILFVLASMIISQPALAEVTQFVFTTLPQSISSGTDSEVITVQSQNAGGATENVTETMDFVFKSSSPTGEFLSTTLNPVSTTMSKNTANKNFIYRDSNTGTFTLTVEIKGRTSLNAFTATQDIVFGSGSFNATTSSSNATNTSNSSNESVVSSQASGVPYSSHSSPAVLGTIDTKIDFQISAGRDRLTSVGNNIVFQVDATKLQNVSEQNIYYDWSFGDGATAQGKIVSHQYSFPGEYTVVVNGRASDKQAVSRIVVKVISPDIVISKVVGGLSVTNRSKMEFNLEGWKIIGNNKDFVFPKDTIIIPGKAIIFDDNVTRIYTENISLLNPLGKTFAVTNFVNTTTTPNKIDANVASIQSQINDVKDKLVKISAEYKTSSGSTKKSVEIASKPEVKKVEVQENINEKTIEKSEQVANVIEVFKAPEKASVGGVLSWPARGFNFIKRLFVEE
jgi:hypothetical protein